MKTNRTSLQVDMQIHGHHVKAVIDSGATGTFIHPRWVERKRIPYQQKERPYQLSAADGKTFSYGKGMVNLETLELDTRTEVSKEKITFDITDIGSDTVILGIDWLERNDPDIDWKEMRVSTRQDQQRELLRLKKTVEAMSITETKRQEARKESKEKLRSAPIRDESSERRAKSAAPSRKNQDTRSSIRPKDAEGSSRQPKDQKSGTPTRPENASNKVLDVDDQGTRVTQLGSSLPESSTRPQDVGESSKRPKDQKKRALPARKTAGSRRTSPRHSAGRNSDDLCTPASREVKRISKHKIARILARRPNKVGMLWLRKIDESCEGTTSGNMPQWDLRGNPQEVSIEEIGGKHQRHLRRATGRSQKPELRKVGRQYPPVERDPLQDRTAMPETHITEQEWAALRQQEDPRDQAKIIREDYPQEQEIFEERTEEALPAHQKWDHEIPLREGAKLITRKMHRMSPEHLKSLREYLETNLEKGYIRPSESEFASPVLFVPKKNGKLRLCVDYRHLNSATIRNQYPLPLISDLQDQLQGAKWFTKFDIREGYYRIRMAAGEEWKTAFKTRFGLYEYCVMPFGLTNAPATFQAVINHALREYLDVFCTAYLDDVLVYTNGTLEEHREHVRKVLKRLQEFRLLVHPDKSEFHRKKVTYLGFIISPDRISMDPEKIEAIAEWPRPESVKDIQSFLGFANFYRKFVKGYSQITAPLTEATKKTNPKFAWTQEMQSAFDHLREVFTTAPVLQLFNWDLETRVETDASDYAIGACLSQKHEKNWKPIAFYSRKMTAPELNYDVHDKELLAIVEAMSQWKIYLEGPKHEVTVFSDHKNLSSFTEKKELNRRQVRWAETLASFHFKIVHKPGTENAAADALSRRSDHMAGTKPLPATVLRIDEDGFMRYNQPKIAQMVKIDSSWEQRIARDYGLQTKGFKVVIPKELQEEFITEYHYAPAHGHPGIDKTIERITRNYHISGIRRKVEKVIQNCQECQKNKVKRHRPYGLLQPLNPAEGAWESISMDFIVKLPTSKEPGTGQVCDSILVIVDRLTKYAYFIPTKESIQAQDMAYLVLRTLLANHQTPREIVTDRGTLFTSTFWQTLLSKLGAKSKLSTSFHPQTDGQTERTNQTLEQYLRIFSNYPQDNWVELLPMAQFAYNSSRSSTTGRTPFYANYGYEPTAYREGTPGERNLNGSHGINEKATQKVEELRSLHDKLREKIAQGNEKMAQQANRKRIEGPILKGGDRVYLLTKNLPTLRLSKKLDAIRIGPFEVKKRIKEVNYELRLPRNMRIRPVFHISLLEPAPADAPLETDIEMEPNQTDYEVEQLLDVRKFGNQWRYLVKWKNYPSEENSWEPIKCLKDCPKRLEQFHQQNPQKHDPRRQNSKAQSSQTVARMRGSTDESRKDPTPTNSWSKDPDQPNSQQADFGQKSSQQQRAAEPRLKKIESSHSRLAPAAPTLQSTKGREPRSRHHADQENAAVYGDVLPEPGNPTLCDVAPSADDQSRPEQPRAQTGPFRESSPKTTTCAPTRTSHNEPHGIRTRCKSPRRTKEHKNASLSHRRNKGASRRDQNEESNLLGQYDGQHEFDPCPWWRRKKTSVPTHRRGHVDPYTVQRDKGVSHHDARDRLRGRSWRRGGRVLRAASQIARHSQAMLQDAEPPWWLWTAWRHQGVRTPRGVT